MINDAFFLGLPQSFEDKFNMIKRHYSLLKKYNNEKVALLEIRMHALWYIKGIPGNKDFKSKITSSKNEKGFLKVIDDFYKATNEKK